VKATAQPAERSGRRGRLGARDSASDDSCNEVRLVGRITAPAQERKLPSGDALVQWRVVVDRPPPRRSTAGTRAATVDALECVAWTPAVQRTARTLVPGDVVEVHGALRRRFWQAGGRPASRTEVDVSTLRRRRRAVGDG
jgi:single-strand DNA-binding protein